MIIKEAKFIISAADEKGFFSNELPQFAVAGKSNVGKSSFINMLANRKKLAKTSNTPGRTRLINYFDMGSFILTDLPGYGYAKASKQETQKWGILIENYLETEKQLTRVIMLVDIRHKPTNQDLQLANYLYYKTIPFMIVATKADKISKSKVNIRIKEIAETLKVGIGDIIATSSQNGIGKDLVLSKIEQIIADTYQA